MQRLLQIGSRRTACSRSLGVSLRFTSENIAIHSGFSRDREEGICSGTKRIDLFVAGLELSGNSRRN